MKFLTKVAAATAGVLCVMLVGTGASAAFAATGPLPSNPGYGEIEVEGNGPAWLAAPGMTAEELRQLPGFVEERDGVFYFARHNWEERHRFAEYQFMRTEPGTPIMQEQVRYRVEAPFFTVESKWIYLDPLSPSQRALVENWLLALENAGLTVIHEGGGRVYLPYEVVNGLDNFNPLTVAREGNVGLSAYTWNGIPAPNVTVRYSMEARVFQELPPNIPQDHAIEQTQTVYWNGTVWVTNPTAAVWVPADDPAPIEGATAFEHRSEPTGQYYPDQTLYATADGGSTSSIDDAAWLTESPGEQWTQFDERLQDVWTEWAQHDDYEWTTGVLAPDAEHPAFYEGFNADTQEFRPVQELVKLTLPATPPADPDPVDPPAVELPAADPPSVVATGGTVNESRHGVPIAAALGAAGVLVVGGVAVTYSVTRHKAAKQQ